MYPQGVCRIRKPACAGNGCAIFPIFRTEGWEQKICCSAAADLFRVSLGQHRTIASADSSGSFAPILQFEKLEIHKVFLRFPNFILGQNLSLLSLAELCGAAIS